MSNIFFPIAFILRTFWAHLKAKDYFKLLKSSVWNFFPFFPGKTVPKSHVGFGQSSCVHLGDQKKKNQKGRRIRLLSYTLLRNPTRVCELARNLEVCSRYPSTKSRFWALGLKTDWVKMHSSSSINSQLKCLALFILKI